MNKDELEQQIRDTFAAVTIEFSFPEKIFDSVTSSLVNCVQNTMVYVI
jgi:hypothetical protein